MLYEVGRFFPMGDLWGVNNCEGETKLTNNFLKIN